MAGLPGHQRLTPQERMRLAQHLRKAANSQNGLTAKQKSEARRHAANLVKINEIEARKRAQTSQPAAT